MKWDEVSEQRCSIARTLSVLGDRWTLLVIRDAFLGVRRFDAFQHSLGVTRHLLSDRLRRLEAAGILERRKYQERPERHEYRLTQKGRDLYPILLSLVGWGDRWMADESGPPMVYEHRGCGRIATPELCCLECGEVVTARDVIPHPTSPATRQGS